MVIEDKVFCRQVTVTDGASLGELYRIYAESMSPREQKPRSEIAAMVTRSDYTCLLAYREGIVIGFSILFLPSQEPFALLEYMAIDEAYRDIGAGAELFRHSMDVVRSARGDITVLLEVDSDREPSTDRIMRRRRQFFYRRLGCVRIEGLRYQLPLPGDGKPPEMDLFAYKFDRSRAIQKSELVHWLRVVYQTVYRVSPDDPRILEMTKQIEDPVRLI